MRLYSASIDVFRDDVFENRIADHLALQYVAHYKRQVGKSEYRSWNYSLRFVKDSIDSIQLNDCHVIVEHELPFTAKRIDVILLAQDKYKLDTAVIIELKQWTKVEKTEIEGNVVTPIAGVQKEVSHPSLQVEGYAQEIQDSYSAFEESPPFQIEACVYCHNYSQKSKDDPLINTIYQTTLAKYPLFTKQQVRSFGEYLSHHLCGGNSTTVLSRFDSSKVRPSKRLMHEFSHMIRGQQVFNLIDEQIAAYNAIKDRVNKLSKTKTKSVIIIKGGPGTGKSVIALETMVQLMRKGLVTYYATGSAALTKTLKKIAGNRASMFFKYFFSFTRHEDNSIDVLICDEAHRLRANSNDWGVPYIFKSRNPQIDDLIRPAKIAIFFIDERQVVRPAEIGSVQLIRDTAIKFGAQVFEYELETQFRCSGSDAYLQWVDNLLEIKPSEITSFDSKMVIQVFNSPSQMMDQIRNRNMEKPNSARIVAGFCWPWSDPSDSGKLVNDVVIGDFSMPWEHKKDFWKWATDESGMEQVGTVYTAQGFEFDYIAVIFGNDLVWRKEIGWVAMPENSHDSTLKRNNTQIVEHLKNVYRVLLSRAHKGVYIYFLDEETKRYFESQLGRI